MSTGGTAVVETRRIICRSCGQYILEYELTAEPTPQGFVVTLVPTNPAHSIHSLRHFLKSALCNFGLKCTDIRETNP